MKEIEITAKTKGQPDIVGKCKQADSWADAVKLAGGEKEALEYFNRQFKTDALNKMRKPATGALALGKLIVSAKTSGKMSEATKNELIAVLKKSGIAIPEGIL